MMLRVMTGNTLLSVIARREFIPDEAIPHFQEIASGVTHPRNDRKTRHKIKEKSRPADGTTRIQKL